MQNTPEYLSAKQKFDEYYDKNILPLLQRLEKKRLHYLGTFLILVPLVLAWFGYVFTHNSLFGASENNIEMSAVGPVGVFLVLLAIWPMLGYYRKSKESILPVMAAFFGKMSYTGQSGISEGLLAESQIIKPYDRLITDDSFFGTYGDVTVCIAEYGLYNLKKSQNNRPENPYYYAKDTGGLLFYAQMNKHFDGKTIVIKDRGFLNSLSKPRGLERIGLESPEFEKKFEVYGNNQIEARYILTPVMMEYMLELTAIFPKIEFSFFKEHILINIITPKNMFECSYFFRSLLDKKRIDKHFNELYLLFSIITTLRLDKKTLL